MLKFISFGSSSSGNCYYLYNDEEGLMIDAGVSFRPIKKYFHSLALPMAGIQNIIITHDHADHVKSVGSISTKLDIPVYATSRTHEGIEHNYCVKIKIPADKKRVIESGVPFQLGGFRITPFDVPHDSLECVGYKIEYQDMTFCLITDVGVVTDEIRQMIGEANYLVLEANHDEAKLMAFPNYSQRLKERIRGNKGHLSNHDCGVALAENSTPKLKRVWLCHLSEKTNTPECAQATVNNVLRDYGLVGGLDFKLEPLERKSLSGPYDLI